MKTMEKGHTIIRHEITGEYYARIQRHGKRKKFMLGFNKKAAQVELNQILAKIGTHEQSFEAIANVHIQHRKPEDMPLLDLVDQYLDWVSINRAEKTHETAVYLLRPFTKFCGNCMVSDLNTATLMKYYAWVKKKHGRGENGGNHHLHQVKTLLRWGEEMEICPCPVRRFPAIREAPAATKKFTDEELARLLHILPESDFKAMLIFGLLTGLRPQELRTLRFAHIREDEVSWSVVLERHKTSMSAEIAQPRCVPLSSEAKAIIEKQLEKNLESPHIFLNDHGKPYTANAFRNRLKRACKRSGIEPKPPYALRHYFGTKRASRGLNQTLLAQLMGHTKLQTTSRYIAAVPEYHKLAMEAMSRDLAALFRA